MKFPVKKMHHKATLCPNFKKMYKNLWANSKLLWVSCVITTVLVPLVDQHIRFKTQILNYFKKLG